MKFILKSDPVPPPEPTLVMELRHDPVAGSIDLYANGIYIFAITRDGMLSVNQMTVQQRLQAAAKVTP